VLSRDRNTRYEGGSSIVFQRRLSIGRDKIKVLGDTTPEKLGRSMIRGLLKRGHLSKDEQQRDGEVALLMQYLQIRTTRSIPAGSATRPSLGLHGDAKAAASTSRRLTLKPQERHDTRHAGKIRLDIRALLAERNPYMRDGTLASSPRDRAHP
jgi:hypothetical protein